MHHQPYLAAVLATEAKGIIAERIRSGSPQLAALDEICAELAAEPITLGQPEYLQRPWIRQMSAGNTADISLLQQGIYPGRTYTHSYQRYRLPILSGARYVSVGVNGGQPLDPMFVLLAGEGIEIRAADDDHRDQLIKSVRTHVDKANHIITNWNTGKLRTLVESALDRHRQTQAAADARRKKLEADGFVPAPSTRKPSQRIPLPDTNAKRARKHSTQPRQDTDGMPYALDHEQFAAVLDCIAAHQNSVERLPGAGASPQAGEEDHRDSLLAALNIRFTDGTAESFSKEGKTDIRLVVDGNSYFHAECKIWGGPKTVDEAVDQLLNRYLTYRDAFGGLVFFVRDRTNPRDLPAKAIERLEAAHHGHRSDDVNGYPVIAVPVPTKEHTVALALIFIVVDEAPDRG